MQLPWVRSQWLMKYYWVGLLLFSLVGVGGTAWWFVPEVRAQARGVYLIVRAEMLGEQASEKGLDSPLVIPLDDPLQVAEEKIASLESKLLVQDKVLEDIKKAVQADHEQFKSALLEVAKLSDELGKVATKQEKVALTSSSKEVEESSTKKSDKVNINTATLAELDTLPGIGPSYAERIIAYREGNGPFKTVDDLDKVKGIGASTIEKLKPLVEV